MAQVKLRSDGAPEVNSLSSEQRQQLATSAALVF
jgi:hypothetical protein